MVVRREEYMIDTVTGWGKSSDGHHLGTSPGVRLVLVGGETCCPQQTRPEHGVEGMLSQDGRQEGS